MKIKKLKIMKNFFMAYKWKFFVHIEKYGNEKKNGKLSIKKNGNEWKLEDYP